MQVAEARKQIHQYVKEGGVRPAAPAEKSKLMVGLDVFTGKAPVSALSTSTTTGSTATPAASTTSSAAAAPPAQQQSSASKLFGSAAPAPSAPPAPPAAVAHPVASSFQAAEGNPFAKGGDPFEEGDDSEGAAAGGNPFGGGGSRGRGSAPPLPPPPSRSANTVEALFDHEAEEEDELNFSAGDLVEVIDKPDGGWWRGRCHGKEGLFPSNYVKT